MFGLVEKLRVFKLAFGEQIGFKALVSKGQQSRVEEIDLFAQVVL